MNKSINKLWSSEAVGHGHPDIIANTISDTVLDKCLDYNNNARVAVETLVVGNRVVVAGEITGVELSHQEVKDLVKQVAELNSSVCVKEFLPNKIQTDIYLRQQSKDIALGVDIGGASDQGTMFGFSCNHNCDMLPTPIFLARSVANHFMQSRFVNLGLGKDCKSQFSLDYEGNALERWRFGKIRSVVLSIHHAENWNVVKLRSLLKKEIVELIKKIYPEGEIENVPDKNWHLNATGLFTIGGPDCDTGVTGRKLIAGTYGGFAHHGGGCLEGKDPSKVDRSGALFLRWLANRIVCEEKLAGLIELQVAYAIGVKEPMSVAIVQIDQPENYHKVEDFLIAQDYSPKSMIEQLNLKNIHYQQAAMFGHFGSQPSGLVYPWEFVVSNDRVAEIADVIRLHRLEVKEWPELKMVA